MTANVYSILPTNNLEPDGEIVVAILSGVPPYRVTINPSPHRRRHKTVCRPVGQSSFTLAYRWKNVPEGTYTVTVHDSHGQVYEEQAII